MRKQTQMASPGRSSPNTAIVSQPAPRQRFHQSLTMWKGVSGDSASRGRTEGAADGHAPAPHSTQPPQPLRSVRNGRTTAPMGGAYRK